MHFNTSFQQHIIQGVSIILAMCDMMEWDGKSLGRWQSLFL